MDISELLSEDCIVIGSNDTSREEVFEHLAHLLALSGKVSDEQDYVNALNYRETLSETGLSDGIAIPHGKCAGVKKAGIAFMTLNKPITDWPSLDEKPIEVVFQLAIPADGDNIHIRMLSELARKLVNQEVIAALKNAKSASDVYEALK